LDEQNDEDGGSFSLVGISASSFRRYTDAVGFMTGRVSDP